MSAKGIRAVAIDLDGTLLDTAAELAEAANVLLEELGRPRLPVETVKGYIGNGVPRLVHRLLTGSRWDDADAEVFGHALPRFRQCYAEALGRTATPYPGVREGLKRLHGLNLPLACVTNKASEFTLPLLEGSGLGSFFSVVVAGDTLPVHKPDPEVLHHVARSLGVATGEVVMIGDSATDVQFARNAGIRIWLVPYGYERADVSTLGADGVVASIDAFVDEVLG